MKYQVVAHDELEGLAAEITRLAYMGWTPLGGVVVDTLNVRTVIDPRPGREEYSVNKPTYLQTMWHATIAP